MKSDLKEMTTPVPRAADGGSKRPAWLGWGAAVLAVVVVWAAAFAMRGGGGHGALSGWQDGIDAGQVQAKELDRPMAVLFTADWCVPCQQLKHDLLTRPEVEEVLMSDFVPVIEDMTNARRDDPRFGEYRVEGFPTLIVMTADGEEIQRMVGSNAPPAESPQAFKAWLAEAQ